MDLPLHYEDTRRNVRVFARHAEIGEGVQFGRDSTIVADRLRLGEGLIIGDRAQLRSEDLDVGADSYLGAGTDVLCPEKFHLGFGSRVEGGAVMQTTRCVIGSEFYFGNGSAIGYGGRFGAESELSIGDQVAVSSGNVINTSAPVRLGPRVGTSDHVYLLTHGLHHSHSVLKGHPLAYAPIDIEANVWLGMRVVILPGVHVGADTIIASSSVVTRSLPGGVLAAGAPAKPKKEVADRVMDPVERWRTFAQIIDGWLADLAPKGAAPGPQDQGKGWRRWNFTHDGRPHRLTAYEGEACPREAWDGAGQLISVALDGGAATGDATAMHFDLEAKTASRSLSPVGEDLRDFLRRHSLACFNGKRFGGLSRLDVNRLLSIV